MDETKTNQHKGIVVKIALVWLSIFLLVGFLVSVYSSNAPVTMAVMPDVPREGDPVVATFNLTNPTEGQLTTQYQLYINGQLAESGAAMIAPASSAQLPVRLPRLYRGRAAD